MDNSTTQGNYLFSLARLPNTQFTVTGVGLPTVSIGESFLPTRDGIQVPIPGTHLTYDPINLQFILAEDFSNYVEILEWLQSMQSGKGGTIADHFSDGEMTILSNNKQPLAAFRFEGCFPTILGEIQFSTQDQADVQVGTLTMRFTQFSKK